jgi:hypothetical protein
MKTNSAYNGLVHPMKSTENGFVPDFQYRYMSEDVPFGLVVMKGCGCIIDPAISVIARTLSTNLTRGLSPSMPCMVSFAWKGTARKIQELRKDLDMSDVIHISDWFKSHYHDEIADDSSLMMSMKTNSAYNGLVHPMNSTENGFVPDFQYRYMSEDVPFGLVVMKGLAEIVGIATPTIDEIIIWTQDKLGKEYIINSKLVGKDAKNVRAPQSFGHIVFFYIYYLT